MSDHYKKVLETKEKLNAVGKGFCLMKWMTQTLYLHMGDNHSCYHPQPHKIQLSDIKDRPSGLHNTEQKKQQRKQMLEGERPSECYYCWNIEDLPGENVSDRMIHSTSDYAITELDRVAKLDWRADVNPRHIEVSFGNACNFKCGYCCPQASSSWMQEIKKHGDYNITTKQYSIDFLKNSDFFHPEDENPYVEAFWKWWPTLKNELKIFRITGGEPLMNPNTMKLLDLIENDHIPELQLHCNSNMGVAHAVFQKFVDKVAHIISQKKVKDFRLFTSIDTWGPRAEYIRNGLSCELWEKNMRYYLETVPASKINFMCTFNILSVSSFRGLLEKILQWRQEYPAADKAGFEKRINFDVPYLKEPPHWMITILPPLFLNYMEDNLKFMEDNRKSENKPYGFDDLEIQKFVRLKTYMQSHPTSEKAIRQGQRDFYTFFTEHDSRRGTSLLSTFPDYAEFYEHCKTVHQNYELETLP